MESVTSYLAVIALAAFCLSGCRSENDAIRTDAPHKMESNRAKKDISSPKAQVKDTERRQSRLTSAPSARKLQKTIQTGGDLRSPDNNLLEKHTALPRMVDYGADKCIPCKMMEPILRDLRSEYAGKVDVIVIDVQKNHQAGRDARIRVIPTQIFYDANGKELFRHKGFYSREEILTKWRELGFDVD